MREDKGIVRQAGTPVSFRRTGYISLHSANSLNLSAAYQLFGLLIHKLSMTYQDALLYIENNKMKISNNWDNLTNHHIRNILRAFSINCQR